MQRKQTCNGRTEIVTPWAPVGAKKLSEANLDFQHVGMYVKVDLDNCMYIC